MTICKNCDERFFDEEYCCETDTEMELAWCDNCGAAYSFKMDFQGEYVIPDFSKRMKEHDRPTL